MQGEALAKDNLKSEGTGKKVSTRVTRFHPTLGPGVKLGKKL
jgi:hypothetical protein